MDEVDDSSFAGGFCAERTEDPLALYKEDEEAVLWSNVEECAAKCRALPADEQLGRSITKNGRQRYLKNGWTNVS